MAKKVVAKRKKEVAPKKRRRLEPTPALSAGKKHTALDVLQFVHDRIKERPSRLYMMDWISMLKGHGLSHLPLRVRRRKPACGTVACMAGWIGIATRNYEIFGAYNAIDALGLSGVSYIEVRSELTDLFHMTRSRTPEVLKTLESIMRRHHDDLVNVKANVLTAKEAKPELDKRLRYLDPF